MNQLETALISFDLVWGGIMADSYLYLKNGEHDQRCPPKYSCREPGKTKISFSHLRLSFLTLKEKILRLLNAVC